MKFRRNPTFERELRAQPQFQQSMAAKAVQLAATIRALAPRETGHYARRVTPATNRVLLRDPFWHLVEYGSVNNPPYAPVRRGVRAAGLRFEDSRAALQ